MDLTNVPLTTELALGAKKLAFVGEIREIMEFVDRKPTGNILGYWYDITCPGLKFAKATVKVLGEPAILTAAEVYRRNAGGNYVLVSFVDFAGDFFKDYKTGETSMRCTATKAVLAATKEG